MKLKNSKKVLIFSLIFLMFLISTFAKIPEKHTPVVDKKYQDINNRTWWLDWMDFGNYVWTYMNVAIYPGLGMEPYWGAWPQQYPKYWDDLNQNEILYYGEMIYGNDKVMNGSPWAYAYEQGGDIDDLDAMEITYLSAMDSISQQDILMGFADKNATSKNKLFIAATWRALQWNYPNVDDFQANIWTLHNYGTKTCDPFYIHFEMDWDIDWNTFENNVVQYYPGTWSSRMSNKSTEVSGGLRFISHEPYSMRATNWDMDWWNDIDVNKPEDQYHYLWEPIDFTTDNTPRDYQVHSQAGPFVLAPGEEIDFIWSFVFGTTISLWETNNDVLTETYLAGWKPPNPPPDAPYLVLTPGDRKVTVRWTRNRSVSPRVNDDGTKDYTEYPDSNYIRSAESSIDPNILIRDWDGYFVYRNLTGYGEVTDGAWHLIAELNSTYVLNTWGSIPENDLDARYWTQSYWAEYTDVDPGLYNGFKYYYTIVSYDTQKAITNPTANMQSITLRWKAEASPENVKVVPNPYKVSNPTPFINGVQFIHLPATCTIKIYTFSGDYVMTLYHGDNSGDETWNLRNDNEQLVAPGVYFFLVESDQGTQKGKFVIIH